MLDIQFVTLFPELFPAWVGSSILGRATISGRATFGTINPRDFTYDRHNKVDDTPYGGEPGMLLRAEPVALAVEAVLKPGGTVILTDPAGERFTQSVAQELTQSTQLVFLCGHYEGIDDRVAEHFGAKRYCIGDYILTNGEMPALVMADSVVRLLEGVLGNAGSLTADSFNGGLLSTPNYTRPEVWRGLPVPAVLTSGHHSKISDYRRKLALELTRQRRPDLLT